MGGRMDGRSFWVGAKLSDVSFKKKNSVLTVW